MKNKILFSLGFLALSLMFVNVASAHQPRLVYKAVSTIDIPFVIQTPDISQAFYGQFKEAKAEYYKVTLPAEQNLYLSLLTPDNTEAAKEVSAQVIKLNSPDSDIKMSLNGQKFTWKKYYEDYAGDNYYQGPSLEKKLPAGDYLITVTAKDNVGKYVLVTGKTEAFPFKEAVKTLFALPSLKMGFFGTSFFSVFAGIIGKYLLYSLIGLLVIVLLVIGLVWYFIRRRKNLNK
ncbi:MAG: hypothetical protein WCF94_00015 [bacterium]